MIAATNALNVYVTHFQPIVDKEVDSTSSVAT